MEGCPLLPKRAFDRPLRLFGELHVSKMAASVNQLVRALFLEALGYVRIGVFTKTFFAFDALVA